jgi:hypothetical protein
MANPQIRIIELPTTADISTTYTSEYLPIESTTEGGRRITVYSFLSSAGGQLFYSKVSSATDRAIATFDSTGALRNNEYATVDVYGAISAPGFKSTSSARYKFNVCDITGSLELVKQLRGVNFNWIKNNEKDVGLIAEEVNTVIPEVVGKDSEGNPSSVDYSKLVAVLINAVKELTARVETLEQKS